MVSVSVYTMSFVHRCFAAYTRVSLDVAAAAAAANHLSDPLIAVLDLTRNGRTNIFKAKWQKGYCNEPTITTPSAYTG